MSFAQFKLRCVVLVCWHVISTQQTSVCMYVYNHIDCTFHWKIGCYEKLRIPNVNASINRSTEGISYFYWALGFFIGLDSKKIRILVNILDIKGMYNVQFNLILVCHHMF